MPKNRSHYRSVAVLLGLLLISGIVLLYFAIPTLNKPCLLVTALASTDGTKIYLQTEPPRFGQLEHRYELDLLTGEWSKLSRNEVLCIENVFNGAPVVRVDKSSLDSHGVPLFRRWFHIPDDAIATDSPTLRMELWIGKFRWSQTWKEFNRYEMRQYDDLEQTRPTDVPPQYALDLIRSRDGSRLVVCKSNNSRENQFELWADDMDARVLARWKGQSIAVDKNANQVALLAATVSGERRIFIHSLTDGALIAEYAAPYLSSTSNAYQFSASARRMLVSDKQSVYLMDYETGNRIPFENVRGGRTRESFRLYGRHVLTETQVFDAENGRSLFKDNSPFITSRMMVANSNRVAEVVKSVSATGPGRALVAAPYLSGEIHVKNLEDNSIHRQYEAPTKINQRDVVILVAFALWSTIWVGFARFTFERRGYLACMSLYLAILASLAVYRLENSGLITQFDRPVKWLLAGIMLATGAQVALWLWCGRTRFWIRSVLSCLYCLIAVLIAKDRVFTRLSATLDGMLSAVFLVLSAMMCVALYIGLRWCYGRWFRLQLEPKTHFSISNLLICVTLVSMVMSVLIPFRKTLLGSVVFEPPASYALLYAGCAIPVALLLRVCKQRLWAEAAFACCLIAFGAIAVRSMLAAPSLSNADEYLSFASFHGAWVIGALACYGQDAPFDDRSISTSAATGRDADTQAPSS